MQSFTVFFLLPLIFTVHAEVVPDFQGTCDQFFYNGFVPQLNDYTDYARICQIFANQYRFATLYDTAKRIPVYSAYTFEKNNGTCERDDNNWRIEPQLVNNNWEDDMMKETELRQSHPNQRNVFMGDRQAINSDYDKTGYDCGHLNPNQHHAGDDCRATFTRTNTVPQNNGLNRSSWKKYEGRLRNEILKDCKTAYVLVGAIPSDKWVKKNNKNRVNIPKYLWHAYCCVDNEGNLRSGAAAVRNVKSNVVQCSIDSLEDFFEQLNLRNVELFDSCIPTKTAKYSGDCASIVP